MFPKVFRASRGGDMSGSRSQTRHRRRGYNTIGLAALMVGLVVWLPATSSAASGDITPPTAPSNLTATATGPRVDLSWDASTDNVLVTGYILERCQGNGCTSFTQIATPTSTTMLGGLVIFLATTWVARREAGGTPIAAARTVTVSAARR